MIDLAALLVGLEAQATNTIPVTHGKAVQAEFLRLVHRISPPLAAELHQGASLRPYTVSPLDAPSSEDLAVEDDRIRIRRGGQYTLRFTGLKSTISERLARLKLQDITLVHIVGARFKPVWLTADCEMYPEAHAMSYEDLWQAVESQPRISAGIALDFLTPTSFKGQVAAQESARNLPLPIPSLVFQSLARKWQAFVPPELRLAGPSEGPESTAGLLAQVIQLVALDSFELRSHTEDFQDKVETGFTGRCEFSLPSQAPRSLKAILHLLAEYAFFAGVGRETAWGRGQTRPVT